jgi:hypothetical protein
MSKIGYTVAFVGGVVVGSLATFQTTKKKYEKLIQEEVDSVKKAFANRKPIVKEEDQQDTLAEKAVHKPDISEYAKILKSDGYTDYAHIKDIPKEEEAEVPMKDTEHPYVISPEEFGDFYDYETISLTYYSDGVLADDNDEEIDNVEEIVGSEALESFGEYEDDSVYVRNDRLKCDYEILLSHRLYSEIVEEKPWLKHDTEE